MNVVVFGSRACVPRKTIGIPPANYLHQNSLLRCRLILTIFFLLLKSQEQALKLRHRFCGTRRFEPRRLGGFPQFKEVSVADHH